MMEVQNSFVLDEMELACLLSYVGIYKIYGFKVLVKQGNLKKNIHHAIYSLCKKAYMRYEKDIILDDEIKRCLCVIKNSDKVISVKRKDNNEQSFVYSSNEHKNLIIVRQSVTREKDIIMCSIHKEDLYAYWIDEGYLLDGRCIQLLEDRDMEEYIEARDDNKRLEVSVLRLKVEDDMYICVRNITVYENFLMDCTINREFILNENNMYKLLEIGL